MDSSAVMRTCRAGAVQSCGGRSSHLAGVNTSGGSARMPVAAASACLRLRCASCALLGAADGSSTRLTCRAAPKSGSSREKSRRTRFSRFRSARNMAAAVSGDAARTARTNDGTTCNAARSCAGSSASFALRRCCPQLRFVVRNAGVAGSTATRLTMKSHAEHAAARSSAARKVADSSFRMSAPASSCRRNTRA